MPRKRVASSRRPAKRAAAPAARTRGRKSSRGERVAVVTGASRGVGRGIARVLGERGWTVYVTGRSTRAAPANTPGTIDETAAEVTARGGTGIAVRCDHTSDAEVAALFARVERERGAIDLVVSNAWGGYERAERGLDMKPFWELSPELWDAMFEAGVRGQLRTARAAAPLLRKGGLLVNTLALMGEKYHGHLYYDVAKNAVRRMTWAMSHDLRRRGVAVVAVAPGFTRTERVLHAFGVDEAGWTRIPTLANTESPEYAGRAIAALADDPDVMARSGKVFEVGALARDYGVTDVDGRWIAPFSEQHPELY